MAHERISKGIAPCCSTSRQASLPDRVEESARAASLTHRNLPLPEAAGVPQVRDAASESARCRRLTGRQMSVRAFIGWDQACRSQPPQIQWPTDVASTCDVASLQRSSR